MTEENIEKLKQDLAGLKETMAIYLGSLITEVVRVFGERGREVVKEAARKGGLWQGQKYIWENKITDRGIRAFAAFYNGMSDVELFKIKVDESSHNRFIIKTNICPYISYWREMGITEMLPEFCVLATYYDLGLAQAFDPHITIELTEDMVRGNCECIYVFKTQE